MRLRYPHSHAPVELQKQIYQKLISSRSLARSRFRYRPASRHLSTVASGGTKHIAVIGAGISGLSAAFWLAQDQSVQVTIYEKSPRLGGSLQSEVIEVDGGQALFEYGPRALRAAMSRSYSTLELVRLQIYFGI
jgi:NADPH-dependent 2,4-dienoyl-CoA reductase/sulfur reductase-like enzyme